MFAPAGEALFFASPKKSTQKKGDPQSATPALRYGANLRRCACGVRRGTRFAAAQRRSDSHGESDHEARALRRACHPATAPPQAQPQGVDSREQPNSHTGLRCARPGTRCALFEALAPTTKGRAKQWPEVLFGCLAPPSPLYAPRSTAASRSGLAIVGAKPSAASSSETPLAASTAGCPVAQRRGRRQWGRLLLPSFLGDARKEGAPPGAHPGTRPGHRHAAKSTSKPWLRQAQPERIRCELLPCPGFDRLSPNGRGWAASRLRQAQPKWLGITPFAINSIAASAYLISARAIKHIKTQRPAP